MTRGLIGLLLVFLVGELAGCAGPGSDRPVARDFRFLRPAPERSWPAMPEVPRYRWIGELTGADNFARRDEEHGALGSALRWLAGLDEGGKAPDGLQRPQGIAVDAAGRIYVSDISRKAILVFDPAGGRLAVWSEARPGTSFKAPVGVATDVDGGVLVADAELGAVFRLAADGRPRGVIGQAELARPTGVARDPRSGHIYVADTRRHQIVIFDAAGRFLDHWGQPGDEPGQFNAPTYLCVAGGRLYVTDTLNARIQILDGRDGRWLRSIGQRGLYVGNFERPKGVAVDDEGNLYVVESYRDHLLIFDDQGRFLLPIGGTGAGIGQFFLPAGVAVDGHNRIYVADMFNGRVAVFQYLGGGL